MIQRHTLLTLILLTQLNGTPVWIESTSIVAIRPSVGQGCPPHAGSTIRLSAMALCVKEKPDTVREILKAVGHD